MLQRARCAKRSDTKPAPIRSSGSTFQPRENFFRGEFLPEKENLPRESDPLRPLTGGRSNPLVSWPAGRFSRAQTLPRRWEIWVLDELELSKFKQRDSVFTRPSVLLNAKRMEPAVWWDTYGKHLPILSKVASSVLAQVVCA